MSSTRYKPRTRNVHPVRRALPEAPCAAAPLRSIICACCSGLIELSPSIAAYWLALPLAKAAEAACCPCVQTHVFVSLADERGDAITATGFVGSADSVAVQAQPDWACSLPLVSFEGIVWHAAVIHAGRDGLQQRAHALPPNVIVARPPVRLRQRHHANTRKVPSSTGRRRIVLAGHACKRDSGLLAGPTTGRRRTVLTGHACKRNWFSTPTSGPTVNGTGRRVAPNV